MIEWVTESFSVGQTTCSPGYVWSASENQCVPEDKAPGTTTPSETPSNSWYWIPFAILAVLGAAVLIAGAASVGEGMEAP